jgi:hypothetical protein
VVSLIKNWTLIYTEEIIIVILILFFLNFYFLIYRNDIVFDFRICILNLSSEYEKRQIFDKGIYTKHYHFMKLPSYYRMVFSFKKLRLSNYFTKEEVKELLEV